MALYIGNKFVVPIRYINQDINVTQNGVYRADPQHTGLGRVVVNVNGVPRDVDSTGKYVVPVNNFVYALHDSIKDIGDRAMYYALIDSEGVVGIDFPHVAQITGNQACAYAFCGCKNITDISMPELSVISGGQALYCAFLSCDGLTEVEFPRLTYVTGGSACYGMFSSCKNLTTVKFPVLATITGGLTFYKAFSKCQSLTSLSFPALTSAGLSGFTDQFHDMLQGTTGVVVHFPSDLQSVIGSWSDVQAGFGGTNTTILFDL